jgi:methylglutaconyl-CoA hydratase
MSSTASPTSARLTIDGAVATITLDQPDKLNAFDDALIKTLLSYLEQLINTDTVRLLKLVATGKHFCAGADLAWMKRMALLSYEDNLADAQELARLFKELNEFPHPTLVRVQGAAYGGAIGLIACCDIAIAADNARFCLSEARLGLAPATIGPYVIAAIGERASRRLFLTAEVFDASMAEHFGLVHEIVPMADLDAQISVVEKNILETGPEASVAAKSLIRDILKSEPGCDLSDHTSALIAQLRVSDEGQEGLSAFFDKRLPSWRCIETTGQDHE